MSAASSPREGALVLIRAVTEKGAMLDEALLPEALPPAERARALSLARAVIRWLGPVDAALASFMKKPPAREVRAILRLGATEILALEEAPHGVVDSAVKLAKGNRKAAPLSGLVNAVLRRVADEGPALWSSMDHARLAAPDWLWKALRADWGRRALLRSPLHISSPRRLI